MRHILVHHYDGVDWNLVEEVAFGDLPVLKQALERIMRERKIDSMAQRNGNS